MQKNLLDDFSDLDADPQIEREERQLHTVFEWVTSFSVVGWAIFLVQRFGSDLSLLIKGVLLLGVGIAFVSAVFGAALALFEYKNLPYRRRFYQLWRIFATLLNGVSLVLSVVYALF